MFWLICIYITNRLSEATGYIDVDPRLKTWGFDTITALRAEVLLFVDHFDVAYGEVGAQEDGDAGVAIDLCED